MRRISDEGLEHVKRWEGCRLSAYKCPAGVWTIGYGSTGPHVKPGMKITQAEAVALLMKDLARFEERVARLVKVPLTDNQHAALVSFDFNTGALHKSTLLKKLNAGNYDAVPSELMKWVKGGGRTLQGLVNRRASEAGLWAKGAFVASNTVPAAAEAPDVLTKETVSWGAGLLSTLGVAFAGNGPVQWALGGILIVAFGVGLYTFIRSRVRPA